MGRARDRASADLNGQEFILDADADTSISADTDDQIDIKIAGADDFQFTANTFTAASGSTIAAQALTATTVTATGAFTSVGIDDNANDTAITIDANEDVELNNGGLYVTNALNSLTVDKGGIDRSGNTTRIISGRSGGNYADFSINIAGTGSAVNRQVYIDYQGNTTLDNGNLVIGTSGKGIDFSATSDGFAANGSEVLSDYERGAYTFATNGLVYQTNNQGIYTRIGDLCFFYVFIHAYGSQNSNTFTCSLPFTVAANNASSNSGYYSNAVAPVMHYRVDTGTAGMVAYVIAGTNYFKLYTLDADGDWGQMTNANFSSEDQAHISGVFMCNPA